jgi:hypothetical protein
MIIKSFPPKKIILNGLANPRSLDTMLHNLYEILKFAGILIAFAGTVIKVLWWAVSKMLSRAHDRSQLRKRSRRKSAGFSFMMKYRRHG